jgi:hypothetical protein
MRLNSNIKINAYKVIDDAVDRAIRYGYQRAHKHNDDPSENQIIEEIQRAVMNELCELFVFDSET